MATVVKEATAAKEVTSERSAKLKEVRMKEEKVSQDRTEEKGSKEKASRDHHEVKVQLLSISTIFIWDLPSLK